MFKGHHPEKTLRLVAFVNEEPPYFFTDKMGSRIYARNCKERQENIVGMICLECLGWYSDSEGSQQIPPPLEASKYPSKGNFVTFCSNEESHPLFLKCINEFRNASIFPCEGIVSQETTSPSWLSWSDHSSFWMEGYPAVMVTDTALFRSEHYHLSTDTYEKLNYYRMARVVGGMYTVIDKLLK